MERIRSNKITKRPPISVPVVEEVVTAPRQRQQARILPDPAQRSKWDLDGYGAPVLAFKLADLPVLYREKKSNDCSVRVYYMGQVLLGAVQITPNDVLSTFRHNLSDTVHQRHATVDHAEIYLRKLLRTAPNE